MACLLNDELEKEKNEAKAHYSKLPVFSKVPLVSQKDEYLECLGFSVCVAKFIERTFIHIQERFKKNFPRESKDQQSVNQPVLRMQVDKHKIADLWGISLSLNKAIERLNLFLSNASTINLNELSFEIDGLTRIAKDALDDFQKFITFELKSELYSENFNFLISCIKMCNFNKLASKSASYIIQSA